MEAIHRVHSQRRDNEGKPWRGIGYHFVIGNGHGMQDGEVAPTFRWQEQIEGAHAGHPLFNEFGIGICLIGNFEDESPTPAQLRALERLLGFLQNEFTISRDRVAGHGQIKSTECPGEHFPLKKFSRYRTAGNGEPQTP